MSRTFVGFGFGAIQSGLFLYEAFKSGNFDRLVVAEVMPEVVDAIRNNGGYSINVASASGIATHRFQGLEIYNPAVSNDWKKLVEAVAEADEIATALPSIDFYDRGETSVAKLLREGFAQKRNQAVVYTGENHNHAAEALEKLVGSNDPVQFLNTVIGKMSGIVTDPQQIANDRLEPMTPGSTRAFLVEQFNRILITKIKLPRFQRGITVFEEQDDLMPFEEAKLYGHNAVHALIGYLAHEKNCRYMSDVTVLPKILQTAREAFLNESGAALIGKYTGFDPLFTPDGFEAYADDLLERMMNPYLRDQVERVIRDPRRKLGWNDRLIGTMRLALSQGIRPVHFTSAAQVALRGLASQENRTDAAQILAEIWKDAGSSAADSSSVREMILN